MRYRFLLMSLIALMLCVVSATGVVGQDIQSIQVADKLFAVHDSVDGEVQMVIAADKGLVVVNSFWSEVTAQRFKSAIVQNLKRDDFIYLLNTIDRLDNFGGNAAYGGIPIVGHRALWDRYKGKEDEVYAEIDRLIKMWRRKEDVARKRLPSHEPGSREAIGEQQWINTCMKRADELESGFSLVLPTDVYEDRRTLDLGDLTLDLIWLGRAGYDGLTVARIPELNLALVPGLHPHHLAPHPMPAFARMDVPRWIEVYSEILEGEKAVDTIMCGMNFTDIWTRERALTHLDYIRKLWGAVAKAEAEGKDLPEILQELSLENEFAFVKEIQVYKDHGDAWIRPQHEMHVRQFFLQHKNPATEMVKDLSGDELSAALAKIKRLNDEDGDIYIEEAGFNRIGYRLLGQERFEDAIAVFRLNVDIFPKSANVYDSYAEALMKSGDNKGAAANYSRSLELDPDNENARRMLEELKKL